MQDYLLASLVSLGTLLIWIGILTTILYFTKGVRYWIGIRKHWIGSSFVIFVGSQSHLFIWGITSTTSKGDLPWGAGVIFFLLVWIMYPSILAIGLARTVLGFEEIERR